MIKNSVAEAIAAIHAGNFVLVIDDENRENEGDLILAAEKATPRMLAFMVRHTTGLICASMEGRRLDELELPLMVERNNESQQTAFTVTVDAIQGTTTGVSAADRALTLQALANPSTVPADLARPGHILPLRYTEGGVMVRPGHTEAAVDLVRLAGLRPTGVLSEVVNADGTMTRGAQLYEFAEEHNISVITIEELIAYRWATEALVIREAETSLPTQVGNFRAIGYRAAVGEREQIALVVGDVAGQDGVVVRIHSECLTGDVLGSLRCDCRAQLAESMRLVAEAGAGVVLYVRGHEGRGIGLLHKLAAYQLQDAGFDTYEANVELGLPADARHYGLAAQILNDLKVTSVKLLTNNPAKVSELEALGVNVHSRLPLEIPVTPRTESYMATKVAKFGHMIGGLEH